MANFIYCLRVNFLYIIWVSTIQIHRIDADVIIRIFEHHRTEAIEKRRRFTFFVSSSFFKPWSALFFRSNFNSFSLYPLVNKCICQIPEYNDRFPSYRCRTMHRLTKQVVASSSAKIRINGRSCTLNSLLFSLSITLPLNPPKFPCQSFFVIPVLLVFPPFFAFYFLIEAICYIVCNKRERWSECVCVKFT